MKWYKHISDSLDDPFIFDLLTKHGSDGYLVFFGILEIYAREFQPNPGWNLSVTLSYLKQKFLKTHRQLITNPLQTISNSGKWDIKVEGEQVTIFIPKFTQLMDEWTMRKLGSHSGVTPKILSTDKDKDKDKDNKPPIVPLMGDGESAPLDKKKRAKKPRTEPSQEFTSFWQAYPRKVGKDAAWKSWQNRNGDRPPLEVLIAAIEKQRKSFDWTKQGGQYIPYPATWINQGRWADEIKTESRNYDRKGLLI